MLAQLPTGRSQIERREPGGPINVLLREQPPGTSAGCGRAESGFLRANIIHCPVSSAF